jgi:hypothetical protein
MHNIALRERRGDKHPWYTEASFDLAETHIITYYTRRISPREGAPYDTDDAS